MNTDDVSTAATSFDILPLDIFRGEVFGKGIVEVRFRVIVGFVRDEIDVLAARGVRDRLHRVFGEE